MFNAVWINALYSRSVAVVSTVGNHTGTAACATAAMLVFQTTLNVLGSVDLLPLTGVTFPFVSMGGSSMLSCWGLLAYLQAAAPPPVSVKAAPKAPAPAVKPPQATGFLDELGVATDDIFGKEDAR